MGNPANPTGGGMSVWTDIDAMQKRFDTELRRLRAHVLETDQRAAESVTLRDDGLVCLTFRRQLLTARSCEELQRRFDELVVATISARSP